MSRNSCSDSDRYSNLPRRTALDEAVIAVSYPDGRDVWIPGRFQRGGRRGRWRAERLWAKRGTPGTLSSASEEGVEGAAAGTHADISARVGPLFAWPMMDSLAKRCVGDSPFVDDKNCPEPHIARAMWLQKPRSASAGSSQTTLESSRGFWALDKHSRPSTTARGRRQMTTTSFFHGERRFRAEQRKARHRAEAGMPTRHNPFVERLNVEFETWSNCAASFLTWSAVPISLVSISCSSISCAIVVTEDDDGGNPSMTVIGATKR